MKWVEAKKALRDNTASSTAKFLYEYIWCRYGCPIELVSDQGAHFVNEVVRGLTQHYVVVHRRSMVYYPLGNGPSERRTRPCRKFCGKSWKQIERIGTVNCIPHYGRIRLVTKLVSDRHRSVWHSAWKPLCHRSSLFQACGLSWSTS
jgi:hypothetical protein